MSKSTFYADGYRDGATGTEPCPPQMTDYPAAADYWAVYANEYWDGYWQAIAECDLQS